MRDGWEPELLQVPVQRISHMMPAVQSGCPPKMFPVGRGEEGNSQLWTALAWRAVLSCWAGEASLLLSALGPAQSDSKHPALQNRLVLLLLPVLLSVLYLLSEGWTECSLSGQASLLQLSPVPWLKEGRKEGSLGRGLTPCSCQHSPKQGQFLGRSQPNPLCNCFQQKPTALAAAAGWERPLLWWGLGGREAAGEASLWSWCWGLLSPASYRYFSSARFSSLPWKQAKLATLKVAAIASYFTQQFHETLCLHHFLICLLGSSGWTEGKLCLWSITSKERLQLFRRELVPCCCMIACGWPADKLSTTKFVTRMALLSGAAPSAPPPKKKDICWVTLVL